MMFLNFYSTQGHLVTAATRTMNFTEKKQLASIWPSSTKCFPFMSAALPPNIDTQSTWPCYANNVHDKASTTS